MNKTEWVTHPNGWEIGVLSGVKDDPESLERVKELLQLINDVAKGESR